MIKLHNNDNLEILKSMADNSIDSIVTDPPAGIAFMNKEWDKNKGNKDLWIEWMANIANECLRVIKPGGHALVWAIPRTSHWTVTAWENAGWIVRDKIYHCFGSGFPKSQDISKQIDKQKRLKRELINNNNNKTVLGFRCNIKELEELKRQGIKRTKDNRDVEKALIYTKERTGKNYSDIPISPEAKQWNGWGTALKPAIEEWILLRKPIAEKTIADNILKYGTGGINIDVSRVGNDEIKTNAKKKGESFTSVGNSQGYQGCEESFHQGRFPANLIHDNSPEVVGCFPEETGKSSERKQTGNKFNENWNTDFFGDSYHTGHNDSGSAARFFYCAKSPKTERDEGLYDLPQKPRPTMNDFKDKASQQIANNHNFHPTVKPVKLMKYLVRLITPPGGTVLDPFMGSGTTGVAADELGFSFIGIELDQDYFEIAQKRINKSQLRLL